ncbi:hypothetical protein HDF18_08570 [Mucilaginibacter sp. X5P1]|uniref:hypothetical protein n=1 Tax=Mucilaginibacter sp. X5P1 TaxID=2723088 RepID=UPI00161866CC|nr:hypothetical protein [Mucilaginibacter sp. X5P1]MBB6137711.1 heme A synthase [Mucilaginibacter sp. X5P1]
MKILSLTLLAVLFVILSFLLYETVIQYNAYKASDWNLDIVLSVIYTVSLLGSIWLYYKQKYISAIILSGVFVVLFVFFVLVCIPIMNS